MAKFAPFHFNLSFYFKNVRYVVIPWDIHLKIYEGYSARYGKSQSAEGMAERGGFGYGEAIEFYPEWDRIIYYSSKWSDDLSEWNKVRVGK